MKKKKILFVAMQMSQHTARWINQIADDDWEVHLFPVNYLPVHNDLKNVIVHQPLKTIKPRTMFKSLFTQFLSILRGTNAKSAPDQCITRSIYPFPILSRWVPYVYSIRRTKLGESSFTAPYFYGPTVLTRLIKKLQPDLIHSLEFQHCGYNVLKAKEQFKRGFPKWMATNWGSDIYYYKNFEDHRNQISRLLTEIDYYSCECSRDLKLAKELGLEAPVMSIMPNTGGFDIDKIKKIRAFHNPQERKIIMVKGYQHFAGRALIALEAIERCSEELKGYHVVVFSASVEVEKRVDELKNFTGINVTVLPHCDHDTMLRMFSRAKIYLGVSVSDAISTSMLEAMAMGAFPIQTDTSCCCEWIKDGHTGFIIPVDDTEIIADRIKLALSDNELILSAAEKNWQTVLNRLDQRVLSKKAKSFYKDLFADNEKYST